MIWRVIGWVAWAVAAYLAITFAIGCRSYAATGRGFQWATAIQTFFWWLISAVFLVTDLSKLHIMWLLPLAFFSGQFLALSRVPLLSPMVFLATRVFMALILLGIRSRRVI